jgi:phosphatidate cytidylyltransferase
MVYKSLSLFGLLNAKVFASRARLRVLLPCVRLRRLSRCAFLCFIDSACFRGASVARGLLLRNSTFRGIESILWLFAIVWGTDIMAYFGGRLIGGPKLCPRISPAKTWSGFIVGISCGALLGLGVLWLRDVPLQLVPFLLLGLFAGALAQGGDLFESFMKRRYGMKDSSRLIPGHGGVMDRLDGFIAAAVLAALIGAQRGGPIAPGNGLFIW